MTKAKKMLMPGVWLVPLNKRSGRTFDHFKHRIDIYKLETGMAFIAWCQDNLGHFIPWNMYRSNQHQLDVEVPNWTVRYQAPGSVFTEVFINPKYMPMVFLKWT